MSTGFRIQGRVTQEEYERYKELKKEYIKQTGEPILDGKFIMIMVDEWAKNQKKTEE